MSDFNKIIELCEDKTVALSAGFKDLMHKWLMPGMSRYVCRYGTLSDGFEAITPAQRYAQCHREMWNRKGSIELLRAQSMNAQADLIDAEAELKTATRPSEKLRAEAKKMTAQKILTDSLVQIEDTLRQLDEFNKVRLELKAQVEAQYPEGLEQAEPENWKAVAKYRAMLENTVGVPQHLRHVPLPQDEKAAIGFATNKPELTLWEAIDNSSEYKKKLENYTKQLERK